MTIFTNIIKNGFKKTFTQRNLKDLSLSPKSSQPISLSRKKGITILRYLYQRITMKRADPTVSKVCKRILTYLVKKRYIVHKWNLSLRKASPTKLLKRVKFHSKKTMIALYLSMRKLNLKSSSIRNLS